MTTIAYRNGVLAADTAVINGYTKLARAITKAVKHHGCVAAAAGTATYLGAFLRWFEANEVGEPPVAGDDDAGMIVRPGPVVHRYEKGGWFQVTAEYYAIGSGRDHAAGAFFMGANAEQAVRAAIEHDPASGGDVTVLGVDA